MGENLRLGRPIIGRGASMEPSTLEPLGVLPQSDELPIHIDSESESESIEEG
jgi:hypothetical protein